MKVLQVIHYFLPKHVAGTEIYTYTLSNELNKNHDVCVYTREDGHFQEGFAEEDGDYDCIKMKTVYLNSSNSPIKAFFSFMRNELVDRNFEMFINEFNPDIVHFQHLWGLSASMISVTRKKNIPVVVTLHDYWFLCKRLQLVKLNGQLCDGPQNGRNCFACFNEASTISSIVAYLFRPFSIFAYIYRTVYMKKMLNKADLIIAPSNFLKNKFIEHGISEGKIIFSDNGVDTEKFKDFRVGHSEKLKFGFVGTIIHHKGVHILIDAFSRINNAELKIYGNLNVVPDYFNELKAMVKSKNIVFIGEFDHKDVARVLSEIDVLIVPSIWYENSPLTIHEAFMAGIPVIASDIGGIPELVRHRENGLLFEAGNAEDLHEKIKMIIDRPGLIKELSENIEPVKTIEENVKELEGIYKQLLNAKSLS